MVLESQGNATTFEVMPLAPGSTYGVVVQGVNSFGRGNESAVGEIITMLGDLAPPPSEISAVVEVSDQGTFLIISWQVSMWVMGNGLPLWTCV